MSKSYLYKASHALHATDYLDPREFLGAVYAHIRAHEKGYSYRRFSEDLGLGDNSISNQLVNGKRRLTVDNARRIKDALRLSRTDGFYFLALVDYAAETEPGRRHVLFQRLVELKERSMDSELDRRTLRYHSAWYNVAIFEMLDLEGFRSDPEWVAAAVHPPIRPDEAKEALDLLVEIGMAAFDATRGRHVKVERDFIAPVEIPGMAIVSFHQNMIDLAKASLLGSAPEDRNISAVTVPLSRESFERVAGMLIEVQKTLMDAATESREPDAVYQINMQLFPLTRVRRSP